MSRRSKGSEPPRPSNKFRNHSFSCLGELIEHYSRTAPGREAILAPGYSPVTYHTLWTRTIDIVLWLRTLGVDQIDRVAVVLPNGPEAAQAMLAVAVGAVCVPLQSDYTADEWRCYFGDLGVAALLTRADVVSASRGVAQNLGIPTIDLPPPSDYGPGAFSRFTTPQRSAIGSELVRRTDDALVFLTSGSTSRPKVVPLTHGCVCLSAYNASRSLELGARDRLLNVLPLFHALGLEGLLTALATGSSVVCTSGFDSLAFFGWLKEFRPTWYSAVPTMQQALLSTAVANKNDAQRWSLRLIRSSTSSLAPDVLSGLEALFGVPVIEDYGMTETMQIAVNPLRRRKPGSVGKPGPAGPEIAIMDSDGRRLAAGEPGEIVLRGPTITRGYDNDDLANKAAFRNGWFRTGDLGYLDQEGYLFIVGRIKEIIDRGGQKVGPGEVERVLLKHPDVVEAVVFPIWHSRMGEDVAAAVVVRQGAKVTAEQLKVFARERLARFKVPGLIRIVSCIPRGPTGKIVRGALASKLGIAPPSVRVERIGKIDPTLSELERELAKTWADLLKIDQIGVDDDVYALGADPFLVAQMISRLRTRFGVNFTTNDLFDMRSVAALAARLESFRT